MRRISGVAHHYAWGDPKAIPDLLGLPADGRPWAEWWLGTHHGGPARLEDGSTLHSQSGSLPYMLKLLAAGSTLSLQTHPTAAQAEAGFAREEAAGIARSASERIYKDPRPKPELLCALTRFDALCGFRDPWATTALLRRIGADHLAARLDREGLAATIASLYRRELDLSVVLQACKEAPDTECRLVTALAAKYPGDPSVVVTLFLQRVVLAPGDAIYLGPGNLHAYLHGVGVEVMGASDNVVRGGLTTKHVDVEELLDVLDPRPLARPIVLPSQPLPGQWRYDVPSGDESGRDRPPFRLWRLEVDVPIEHTSTGREILLCTGGDVGALAAGQAAYLAPGETIRLEGGGTLFRVEEPPA